MWACSASLNAQGEGVRGLSVTVVDKVRIPAMADSGWKWKWSLGLLNAGVLGMTMALLIAGYEQSFMERGGRLELERLL
jgi:hypothetical protein